MSIFASAPDYPLETNGWKEGEVWHIREGSEMNCNVMNNSFTYYFRFDRPQAGYTKHVLGSVGVGPKDCDGQQVDHDGMYSGRANDDWGNYCGGSIDVRVSGWNCAKTLDQIQRGLRCISPFPKPHHFF